MDIISDILQKNKIEGGAESLFTCISSSQFHVASVGGCRPLLIRQNSYPPRFNLSLPRQIVSTGHRPSSAYNPLTRGTLLSPKEIDRCITNSSTSISLSLPFLGGFGSKVCRGRGGGTAPDPTPLLYGSIPCASGFGDFGICNGLEHPVEVVSVAWSPRWHTFGDWCDVESALAKASETEKAVYESSVRTEKERSGYAKKDTYLLLLSPSTADALTPNEFATLLFTHSIHFNDPIQASPLSPHASTQNAFIHFSQDPSLLSTNIASLIAHAAAATNPTSDSSVIAIRLS